MQFLFLKLQENEEMFGDPNLVCKFFLNSKSNFFHSALQ